MKIEASQYIYCFITSFQLYQNPMSNICWFSSFLLRLLHCILMIQTRYYWNVKHFKDAISDDNGYEWKLPKDNKKRRFNNNYNK